MSPLYTDSDRAALDYATQLSRQKHVTPEMFQRLAHHFDEREICDIVYVVASEHVYNIGLNIGSDDLCAITAAN